MAVNRRNNFKNYKTSITEINSLKFISKSDGSYSSQNFLLILILLDINPLL